MQFPPFSSELFSLPTSTPSGLWGKLLMKGWKSHFFKEGKFFGNKIELKYILPLLIKYMPVLYFWHTQIILLLLYSARKHARLAFVTPGLYSAAWGNQAWFPHCVLYSHFRKQAEILEFGLFLPPFSAGNRSLVPRRAAWHSCQSSPADCCWRWLVSRGSIAPRFVPFKEHQCEKDKPSLGSELEYSCWSLKTTKCFAIGFPGREWGFCNWGYRLGALCPGTACLCVRTVAGVTPARCRLSWLHAHGADNGSALLLSRT